MNSNEKRKIFLEYIKETFNVSLVYYPASGWDALPKEIFGIYNVIHLSLEEDENEIHYFEKLGDGIKIFGDMRKSPIADKSIDMIYLNLYDGLDIIVCQSLEDFKRVLKNNGIIVVEGRNYYERKKWENFLKIFNKDFLKIKLPRDFRCNQVYYGIRKNNKEKYMQSQEDMIEFVSKNKEWTGFKVVWDYAVFKKI